MYAIRSYYGSYALLAQGMALDPDAPALSFFLRSEDYKAPFTWTQREWFGGITQTANMLRALGLERGDVVAFVLRITSYNVCYTKLLRDGRT